MSVVRSSKAILRKEGASGWDRLYFAFTFLPDEPKSVVALYVNDMGQANWDSPEAGTWIDA